MLRAANPAAERRPEYPPLHRLVPDDGEVAGLLAPVLLTEGGRAARVDPQEHLLLAADQDRSRWDREAIDEGPALVRVAPAADPPAGRYALMAAIAAMHAEASRWADSRAPRPMPDAKPTEGRWPDRPHPTIMAGFRSARTCRPRHEREHRRRARSMLTQPRR